MVATINMDNPPSTQGRPVVDMEKQVPRPPRTVARAAEIRLRNRRREYLRRNPKYFSDLEHEFADPVMYESLVRRFQSAAEREADSNAKGYSRILEGDLLRGEAKLQSLSKQAHSNDVGGSAMELSCSEHRLPDWASLEEVASAKDQEEGRKLWHDFLTERFIKGGDCDFDYGPVDADEELDIIEKQDAEDAWFEAEDPSWADHDDDSSPCERTLQGETGIQDF